MVFALDETEDLIERIEKLGQEADELRDRLRVRDARTEPPQKDQDVLVWTKPRGVWRSDCWLVDGKNCGWMWGYFPDEYLWMPMPPAPEIIKWTQAEIDAVNKRAEEDKGLFDSEEEL